MTFSLAYFFLLRVVVEYNTVTEHTRCQQPLIHQLLTFPPQFLTTKQRVITICIFHRQRKMMTVMMLQTTLVIDHLTTMLKMDIRILPQSGQLPADLRDPWLTGQWYCISATIAIHCFNVFLFLLYLVN